MRWIKGWFLTFRDNLGSAADIPDQPIPLDAIPVIASQNTRHKLDKILGSPEIKKLHPITTTLCQLLLEKDGCHYSENDAQYVDSIFEIIFGK